MKKYFVLLLSATLILSVFVACSASNTDKNNTVSQNQTTVSSALDGNETTILSTTVASSKQKESTASGADNDVDFAESTTQNKTRLSDKITASPAEPEKTTEPETASSSSNGNSPTKISTDKDGWVDKWY